ncbi:MAG: zinc-dependent peptidase [Janthinobacterium lividum]
MRQLSKPAFVICCSDDSPKDHLLKYSISFPLLPLRLYPTRQTAGIHEFAHLLDAADGVINGVPQVALLPHLLGFWAAVARSKMEALRTGKPEINFCASINEAEFFAVVTEHFFEQLHQLQVHRPELYALLTELSTKASVLAGA